MKNRALEVFLEALKKGYDSFSTMDDGNMNFCGRDGDYPIHYAVIQNKVTVVKQMLACGMDVNIFGEDECTPLDYAILHEHETLAELLKLKGGETHRV